VRRFLPLLLTLLAIPALGAVPTIYNNFNPMQAFIAVGGNTAISLAQRMGWTLTPLDFGAYRDTKQVSATVGITASASALTCSSCNFSSVDVGKRIVVQYAGATQATGAISSIPVASGGSYTAQPSIAFTSGVGGYAVAAPIMGVASATIATAGAGYNNGTWTCTLTSYGAKTVGAFDITFSGGVASSVGAITPGLYWNITSAGYAGVYASCPIAAGGSTSATFNLTYTVVSASILTGGWGYTLGVGDVTAAPSGGSYTVAATFGTVVVTPPVLPLASTIIAIIDATHATLADAAGTTVAGTALVTWGHDDAAGIQSAVNAICATASAVVPGSSSALSLPGDGWGLATTVQITPACDLLVYGSGRKSTNIRALATPAIPNYYATYSTTSLPSMIYKGDLTGIIDIRDLRIDGSHLVATPLFLHGAAGGSVSGVEIANAAPQVPNGAAFVIGDPVTYRYAAALRVYDITVRDEIGTSAADYPLTAIGVYAPDNQFGDGIYAINGALQDIIDTGSNSWVQPHPWNTPGNLAQYNMVISGGRVDQPDLDSPAVAGLRLIGAASAYVSSPYCQWPVPAPTTACVLIENGIVGIIDAPIVNALGFPAANVVVQNGTAAAQTIVTAGAGQRGDISVNAWPGSNGPFQRSIVADGTIVGGLARGSYAFDGQVYGSGNCRNGNWQVASGTGAVALGCKNQVSGYFAGGLGSNNAALQSYDWVLGSLGTSNQRAGQFTYSGGSNAIGIPEQISRTVIGARTTSTTPTRMWVSVTPGATNSVPMPTSWVSRMDIKVLCQDTTTFTDFATWHFPTVIFSRASGATWATMTPASAAAVADAGTTTGLTGAVTLTNDTTTYPGPNVTWTAPNSHTWDCFAEADILE